MCFSTMYTQFRFETWSYWCSPSILFGPQMYSVFYCTDACRLKGWRLEVKGYPRLTEHGAWRGKEGSEYGGFYTQEEVRNSNKKLVSG